MNITTKTGQCLLDVAVHYGGDVEAAAAAALAADIPLSAGTPLPATLDVPVVDELLAKHFSHNGFLVATDV